MPLPYVLLPRVSGTHLARGANKRCRPLAPHPSQGQGACGINQNAQRGDRVPRESEPCGCAPACAPLQGDGGGSFLPHPPLPSPSLTAGERFPYARERGRGAGGSLIAGAGGDVRRSGGWHGAGRASERSEIEADKSLGDVEGAVIHGRENRGAPSPPPSIGDGRERERRRGERACAGGAGGRHFWWMV